MDNSKNKVRFSYKDLLYKTLIFVATVTVIVYFLPREGKFNYQFDINKPWKYGLLTASFDFPVYKDETLVKQEQDSILALYQPYYLLDNKIEETELAELRTKYATSLKHLLPSVEYIKHIESTLQML
ncbi:MAG: hydrolase, partial [Bacteroidaceae bacterium]